MERTSITGHVKPRFKYLFKDMITFFVWCISDMIVIQEEDPVGIWKKVKSIYMKSYIIYWDYYIKILFNLTHA